MIKKTTIVAICGKSASGKDSLASNLYKMLSYTDERPHLIISDTTRPQRPHEKDGTNYHFLTKEDFGKKIRKGEYLEYDQFNHWFYGTPLNEIKTDLNIGVFTPKGVKRLCRYADLFDIVVIYVKVNFLTRIKRSKEREGKWSFEFIRRACADNRDFKNFSEFLAQVDGVESLIVTRESNEKSQENPIKMAQETLNFLRFLGKIK